MQVNGNTIDITGGALGLGLAGVIRTYVCNVTQEQEVEDTFNQINNDFGQIDGLVNNAGILRDGLFLKV